MGRMSDMLIVIDPIRAKYYLLDTETRPEWDEPGIGIDDFIADDEDDSSTTPMVAEAMEFESFQDAVDYWNAMYN